VKVSFLSLAQKELDDAVAWYSEQASGLGIEFLDELDRAVRRAATFRLSCPKVEPGIRRFLVTRFPYGVVYGGSVQRNGALIFFPESSRYREGVG
jgi:plasmid stabilization system protein ParE